MNFFRHEISKIAWIFYPKTYKLTKRFLKISQKDLYLYKWENSRRWLNSRHALFVPHLTPTSVAGVMTFVVHEAWSAACQKELSSLAIVNKLVLFGKAKQRHIFCSLPFFVCLLPLWPSYFLKRGSRGAVVLILFMTLCPKLVTTTTPAVIFDGRNITNVVYLYIFLVFKRKRFFPGKCTETGENIYTKFQLFLLEKK